jgi:hypothetical protein
MRYFAAPFLLALASCNRAGAVQPDSSNPAHCIAAFHYGAYWFKVGNRPDKVTDMVARGMFEMQKIKSSGGSASAALAEGKALTRLYAADSKKMDALFTACGLAQDADPRFREELPELRANARLAQAARSY